MRTNRMNSRLIALAAFSFSALAAMPSASARDLSFDARLAAQKAVEQVYWNHRIWPAENPGQKPPFQAVMSDATIASKVEDVLRASALLDSYWKRALTGEQLQAEIDRMVRETRAPGTLREIFAALDDDPSLIAECLARPILASRLSAAEFASDERIRGGRGGARSYGEWSRAAAPEALDLRAIEPPRGGYTVPSLPSGGCAGDAWELSTLTDGSGANVPAARQLHTTVWTGSEMIVWGGWDGGSVAFANGGRYDPATDSWSNSTLTTGSGANVPAARYRHTAIWTGSEMIVWGGRNVAGSAFNDGGRYDPAADTWSISSLTSASGANVPSARESHTAVWTGTSMIVWGGRSGAGSVLKTGGVYDPVSDSWSNSALTIASDAYTPVARVDHTALWTGSAMIVWGGRDAAGSALKTGGRYDPIADEWPLTSLTDGTGAYTPSPRYSHTAIWTGNEMIVWGGAPSSNTGGKYRPSTDTWALTSLTTATGANVPAARQLHTAVWTGSEMIVWGGSTDGSTAVLNTGGRFTPITDQWTLSTLTDASGPHVPSARQFHSALWTGASDHRMIVWGGSPTNHTGGLYCAVCTPRTWYADVDGDGYGNPAASQSSCTAPPGYVAPSGDCDDANAAIHPGAVEVCDGLDDNCDTVVDNGGNAVCDDGNACTADVCHGTGGCVAGATNLNVTGFSASRVDGRDLVVLAAAWNSCPGDAAYNAAANLDQVATVPGACVDVDDFHLFMNAFGHSCL